MGINGLLRGDLRGREFLLNHLTGLFLKAGQVIAVTWGLVGEFNGLLTMIRYQVWEDSLSLA